MLHLALCTLTPLRALGSSYCAVLSEAFGRAPAELAARLAETPVASIMGCMRMFFVSVRSTFAFWM
jgi:hypothetical protein